MRKIAQIFRHETYTKKLFQIGWAPSKWDRVHGILELLIGKFSREKWCIAYVIRAFLRPKIMTANTFKNVLIVR
jgi:hypothetical protein